MNYLAHLYLAGDCPDAQLGNLLGDFVKGPPPDDLPETLRRGILLHRRIDAYTDAHPVVLRSKRRISPERRRFAGVIVDILYDHFLARDWTRYSMCGLPEFTARFYACLEARREWLPERLRLMAPRMAAEDWLSAYAEVEGIHRTFQRLARRVTRVNPLAGGAEELLAQYDALRADFTEFFPELAAFAAEAEAGASRRQP